MRYFINNLFFHLVLAATLIVTPILPVTQFYIGSSRSAAAADRTLAESEINYQQASKKLADLFRSLQQARESFDESEFSPAARARLIGKKIDDLYGFVRDQVRFEPYHGLLRMADGTLMSRSGNAFDQSILLASMLKAHGYPVRYVQAELPDAQAHELLDSMKPANESSLPRPLNNLISPKMANVLRQLGSTEEEITSLSKQSQDRIDNLLRVLSSNFANDLQIVKKQLEASEISLPPAGDRELKNALGATRNHCWVQVYSQNKWIDLDPTAPTLNYGERLAEPTHTLNELPLNLTHRLSFQVTVEQDQGGKIKRLNVLDKNIYLDSSITHFELAFVPNYGQPLSVANLTDKEFLQNFKSARPVLRVNGKNFNGTEFDLNSGAKAPSSGGGFGGLGKALGGIFDDNKTNPGSTHVRKVVLTLTSTGPQGQTKKIERVLVNRPQGKNVDDKQANSAVQRQILGRFNLLASGSRISADYIAARQLDHFLDNQHTMSAIVRDSYGLSISRNDPIFRKGIQTFPFKVLELLATRAAILDYNAATYFPGLTAYFGEPQLVAFRQGDDLVEPEKHRSIAGFDIIANHVNALPLAPKETQLAQSAEFRLQQGVVDTLLEYLLLGGGEVQNTHSVLAHATKNNIPLALIRDVNDPRMASLSLPALTKDAIARDLQAGYLVLAPQQAVPRQDYTTFAWWRIDPVSGATLGMGGDGQGQAITTRVIIESAVVGAVFNIAIYWGTTESDARTWEGYGKAALLGAIYGILGATLYGKLVDLLGKSFGSKVLASSLTGALLGGGGHIVESELNGHDWTWGEAGKAAGLGAGIGAAAPFIAAGLGSAWNRFRGARGTPKPPGGSTTSTPGSTPKPPGKPKQPRIPKGEPGAGQFTSPKPMPPNGQGGKSTSPNGSKGTESGTTGPSDASRKGPVKASIADARNPKPNTLYESNGYHYRTDANGRLAEVSGDLRLNKAARNKHQQTKVGKSSGVPDDEGGHMIGAQFNGPGEGPLHMVPQASKLNRGAGSKWTEMERLWAAALRRGDKVSVKIEVDWPSGASRPDGFSVRYEITNSATGVSTPTTKHKYFKNP